MKIKDTNINYRNCLFTVKNKRYELCNTTIINNKIKVKLLEYTDYGTTIPIERVGDYSGIFGVHKLRVWLNNVQVTFDLYSGEIYR